MTQEEFGRIALAISKYYPQNSALSDKTAVRLWYEQLKDLDYSAISLAVSRWVQVEKWPPTIADLRKECQKVTGGEAALWVDEWDKVSIGVRSRFGRYMEKEALESFSPITRRVVKAIGWKNLCDSENPMADRAHFERMYTAIASDPSGRMSPALKELVAQTQKQLEAK